MTVPVQLTRLIQHLLAERACETGSIVQQLGA